MARNGISSPAQITHLHHKKPVGEIVSYNQRAAAINSHLFTLSRFIPNTLSLHWRLQRCPLGLYLRQLGRGSRFRRWNSKTSRNHWRRFPEFWRRLILEKYEKSCSIFNQRCTYHSLANSQYPGKNRKSLHGSRTCLSQGTGIAAMDCRSSYFQDSSVQDRPPGKIHKSEVLPMQRGLSFWMWKRNVGPDAIYEICYLIWLRMRRGYI